jgi:hypothetical protein
LIAALHLEESPATTEADKHEDEHDDEGATVKDVFVWCCRRRRGSSNPFIAPAALS